MSSRQGGSGGHRQGHGCASWGAVGLMAMALAARGQPADLPRMAPAKPGPKGAAGKVIQYEEKPSAAVIYQEETGGMMSPLPKAPAAAPRVSPEEGKPTPPRGPGVAGKPGTPAVATKPTEAPSIGVAGRPAAGPGVAAKKPAAEPGLAAKKPAGAPRIAAQSAAPAPDPAASAFASWGARVDQASEAGDSAALLRLAADPAARLDCDRAYRSWSIARAQEEKGDVAAATRTLDPILTGCADGVVRATTLEIARELVEPETLARWIAREAPNARAGEAQQRYDRLAITTALARNSASKAPPAERARALDKEIAEAVVRFRDAEGATGLGWTWLEAKDPASAALWFGRALTWRPGDDSVTRGLAYAALQERRFDDALRYVSPQPDGEEKRRITRDAYIGKAEGAYTMDRFAEALAHYGKASEQGTLPRYAREQEAWSYARTGRKAEAAKRFAALYREAPDRGAADGLLAAYENKTMIDADLRASEPLNSMLRAERAVAAFNASRFLEAAALDPGKYGEVGATSAPQASAYAGWRKKTGEDGTSRLKSHRTYAGEAGAVVAESTSLRLRGERHELRAGTPAAGALIGTAPAGMPLPTPIEETRATVDEGRLGVRIERGVAINAHAGAISSDAGLSQRAIGGLEVEAAPAWGFGAVGIYREPVRESILSYAGMRDPYSGTSWGRVSRDALSGRALVLMSPWSFGASARFARLTGTGVQDNDQKVAELSAGYNVELPDFAYASTSVSVSGDMYERNLSNFTLGHGGYFSPQRYRRLGAAFDFMTAENRRWIARGRFSAGLISKQVDEAPLFPLAPDGRVYPGTPTERAHDASANVVAVARLSPHVQLAAGLSRSISPQYAENHAFVQIRILFEPRASVVSADLPGFVR